MLQWQPFLAFYIWAAHWRHLVNMTEPFNAMRPYVKLLSPFDWLFDRSFLHPLRRLCPDLCLCMRGCRLTLTLLL